MTMISVGRAARIVGESWFPEHRHSDDEYEFEKEFLDTCSICRENLKRAIQDRQVCAKHPFSYCEPARGNLSFYCEDCDNETKGVQDDLVQKTI